MPEITHTTTREQWLSIPPRAYLDGREVRPMEYYADGSVKVQFQDNGQIVTVKTSEVYTA